MQWLTEEQLQNACLVAELVSLRDGSIIFGAGHINFFSRDKINSLVEYLACE